MTPGDRAVVLVLYGVTGDLAGRKILPALYNLHLERQLPERFLLLGVGRREGSDQALRETLRTAVAEYSRRSLVPQEWARFAAGIQYLRTDLDAPEGWTPLVQRLEAEQAGGEPPDVIHYLSVPPSLFAPTAQRLGEQGLAQPAERVRIVIEKPVGRDLASFREINAVLARWFEERQVFRIDHFLGKETVQNILALRFANPVFEPIWNRNYVDHVAITVAETQGIGGRGGFYEQTGALRDMLQNHLLQLLCLVAMEPPAQYLPEDIRNRKMDVMHALRPIPHHHVERYAARGQYGAGWLGGEQVPAYRDEPGVAPESTIETFAALKLHVDNWRWQGVHFFLRSGKRMGADVSEISLRFHEVPHCFIPGCAGLNVERARLEIRIAPDPGITLRFAAKEPGYVVRLRPAEMHFRYREAFRVDIPEAYETLLRDVMLGDCTLFMRADQVDAAWRLLQPVLEQWEANPPPDFPNYTPGSWGPEAAELLIAGAGRAWRAPARWD